MKKSYIPQEKRKNILLITDDVRSHSGIAHIGRETILNTCHQYNYIQIAGAIGHRQKGQKVDLSKSTQESSGVEDAKCILYPTDGYGNPDMVRHLIEYENIDAIFLITDPRYFTWLFNIENEIRKKIPIIYLNIWDNYPAPAYNKEFYESCDLLMGISKQTVNINKIVLGDKAKNKIIEYVPHGLNHKIFFPINKNYEKYNEFKKFKSELFGGKEYKYSLLFNSRNIRRKSIPDTLLAWKVFIDKLVPNKERKNCVLVLHTALIDQNGTDLEAVIDYLFGENPEDYNIIVTNKSFSTEEMNYLYNSVDGVILLSSNEGWGLSLTESLLTGTPFIANVTGGMQDQMRFVDTEGKWFTPDKMLPSNHRDTLWECGEWAFPVFPSNISLNGSVPTPYIFDDRCDFYDAADQIFNLYRYSSEERKEKGLKGREFALGEAGFTAEIMGQRIINNMEHLFSTWKPREKFEFLSDNDYELRTLQHNIFY